MLTRLFVVNFIARCCRRVVSSGSDVFIILVVVTPQHRLTGFMYVNDLGRWMLESEAACATHGDTLTWPCSTMARYSTMQPSLPFLKPVVFPNRHVDQFSW